MTMIAAVSGRKTTLTSFINGKMWETRKKNSTNTHQLENLKRFFRFFHMGMCVSSIGGIDATIGLVGSDIWAD
jgi:hypothetical protein